MKNFITLATIAICLAGNAVAQQLSFNDFSLIGGSDLQSGASYRFYNVTSGVDAIIDVTSLSNATLTRIDDSPVTASTQDDAAWRPGISGVSTPGTNELHYADFTLRFFANGDNTPVGLDSITMSIYDTDGDGDLFNTADGDVIEFAQVAGFSSLHSAGSQLNVIDYADGSKLVMAKDSTSNAGVTAAAEWLSVWQIEGKHAYAMRLGWMGSDSVMSADNDRLYGAYFTGENTPMIVPVPEPSAALLTALGALVFSFRRRRK